MRPVVRGTADFGREVLLSHGKSQKSQQQALAQAQVQA